MLRPGRRRSGSQGSALVLVRQVCIPCCRSGGKNNVDMDWNSG